MLIKKNVYFSAVDEETGEEKLFSVNEIMTEEEYLERMYSAAGEGNTGRKVGKAVAAGTAGLAATGAAVYGAEKGINKLGDVVVKKVTNKQGVNGNLTPLEKRIKDIAVKARDAKTIQNVVQKAGKALRIVK